MVNIPVFLIVIIAINILVYLIYRNYYGLLFCGTGIFLNFLVMSLNGFKMPVRTSTLILSDKYCMLTGESKLWFLADIIKISNIILSIGDIVVIIGVLVLLLNLTMDIKLHIKEVSNGR